MPADPHPFLHPDPAVAQAARDKAKPMAPLEGELPMFRYGEVWRTPASEIDVEAWEGSGVFGDGAIEYDIIAAVDPVTGAVIRTAEGVVEATEFVQARARVIPAQPARIEVTPIPESPAAPPASTGAVVGLRVSDLEATRENLPHLLDALWRALDEAQDAEVHGAEAEDAWRRVTVWRRKIQTAMWEASDVR